MTDCVRCSKRDYDQIVSQLAAFWGDDRMRALHHPIFLHEFGDCAHVIRVGEPVVASLFGLVPKTRAEPPRGTREPVLTGHQGHTVYIRAPGKG